MWISELRFLAEYGLTSNLALQGVLPIRLIDTRTRYTDLAGTPVTLDYDNIHHRDETILGAGDPQLLLHGGAVFDPVSITGRAGFAFPLGSTVPDPYALGARGLEHEHLQLGNGTLDPVLGADLSIRFDDWSLATFGNTRFPVYEGPRGYQAGARYSGGAVAISGLGLEDITFRVAFSAYHEAAERWHGKVPTDDGNQGRTDLYAGPGITVPIADDWSVSLDVRARVYGQTVNAQLELPLLVDLSFGTLLHLESDDHHLEASTGDVEDLVEAGEVRALLPVAGKWTIFDFWAPWCEACGQLDGALRSLAERDPQVAIRRVNIVSFDSPIALRELPGVSVLPRVRVVDPSGAIVYEESGPVDQLLFDIEAKIANPR